MEEKSIKLSDDAILYLRDILTLGLITRTDIIGHLRVMKFTTELRGEVEYLVPTESYKKEYAVVAEQLLKAIEQLDETSVEEFEESSSN